MSNEITNSSSFGAVNKPKLTYDDYVKMNVYDERQLYQIWKGLKAGIDVSLYEDPNITAEDMEVMLLCLSNGLDASFVYTENDIKDKYKHLSEPIKPNQCNQHDIDYYSDLKIFNNDQLTRIFLGLYYGLDVEVYAKPYFDQAQMEEIRIGLELKLDVSIYAKPEFNFRQMRVVRCGLVDNLNISIYANTKFDWLQMEQLRIGLRQDLDVSIYADPKYDSEEMEEIRLRLLKEME